ncbi:hypothetical protein ACS0TY_036224 [Phlomoides rotata]
MQSCRYISSHDFCTWDFFKKIVRLVYLSSLNYEGTEGFLKPIIVGKSFEVVAEEYLMELVDRNLIIILDSTSKEHYDPTQVLNALQSAPRSLIVHCNSREVEEALLSANLRLQRYFKFSCESSSQLQLESANINSKCNSVNNFAEIWMMPLLTNVKFSSISSVADPPSDDFVLGNLQSLSRVRISQCREKVVKGIPNIKKLKISCGKLEHLSCDFHMFPSLRISDYFETTLRSELQQNIAFPRSLKKLSLHECRLHWEDIATKIGPLPLLQILILGHNSFVGPDWVTLAS